MLKVTGSKTSNQQPATKSIMKNSILIISFLLIGSALFAQPDLPTEQVEIIKSFDAHLLDTEKLKISPILPPLDTTTIRQTYIIPPKTVTVDYLPPTIRPIAIRSDKLPESYNGYAKLGAGLPTSFYAEGSYDAFVNKKYDFGFNMKHHSANNGGNVEKQRFSFTTLGGEGTYYMDQGHAVNGHLRYTNDGVHLYGYNTEDDPTITYEPDDVKQRFSIFDAGAKIFNGERTIGDFNYSAGMDLYYMDDNYATRENGFDLKIDATKWIKDVHSLNVLLRTDFTSYKDTTKQNLHNFFLNPSFTYHADAFKAKIGANLASHNDEFFLFPDAEVSLNIFGNGLIVFAGADGTLQKNSFRALSDYNPDIVSRIKPENTNYYRGYGGLKGNVRGIEYRGQVSYKKAKNLALYLTDFADPNNFTYRFRVLYDDVSIFNLKGTLSAKPFDGLEVIGTLSQSVFDPTNQEKAWHLPTLEVNLAAKYLTMEDKLRVKAELFVQNGVPYIDETGKTDNLNKLFDVSVGAAYQFGENFGVFLDVYNLAANKRERWHRYPTFGMNVLAGLTARF